jgi:hypothetical protein
VAAGVLALLLASLLGVLPLAMMTLLEHHLHQYQLQDVVDGYHKM